MANANFITNVWIYVQNCGDGSARARLFGTEADANLCAATDPERFEDDIYIATLEFDSNGEFVNASR